MKRGFDICAAVVALVSLAPLMLAVAGLIYFTDGRPVLFKQTRMGLAGLPFELFKFRSMVKNAQSTGGYSTIDNDPRITAIGRFLRKTSIDELPQLFNVLRGDMSIVGPRPDVREQVADYTPEDWQMRCSVRPGITGLAQARMRSVATPSQRLALDLEYAENSSLIADFAIITATIVVLFRKRAN